MHTLYLLRVEGHYHEWIPESGEVYKTPYRNGTTHVIFEPVDFMARLAALVPKPRVNLTRFHGVFAPNSKHRINVTPAKRGKGRKELDRQAWDEKTTLERHTAMTWPFSHI